MTESFDFITTSSITVKVTDTRHNAITDAAPKRLDTPPTILKNESSKSCEPVVLNVEYQNLDVASNVQSYMLLSWPAEVEITRIQLGMSPSVAPLV
jgi:hypothetical protein